MLTFCLISNKTKESLHPCFLMNLYRVSDTTFRRLGLWQVCIAGFRNPKNYWGKVYYGCWWLFAREYNGLRADEILTPRMFRLNPCFCLYWINLVTFWNSAWFIAVQTFACFGLIFNMLCSAALVVVAITRYRLSRRSMLIGCILSACACKYTSFVIEKSLTKLKFQCMIEIFRALQFSHGSNFWYLRWCYTR